MSYHEVILERRSRKKVYLTADDFLADCVKYFEWATQTPIMTEKATVASGDVIRYDEKKLRVFTKKGLALHLGITTSKLASLMQQFPEVGEIIEQVIYVQKFENAAVGVLNSTMMAKDLGIAEKQEISGPQGGPVEVSFRLNMIPEGKFFEPDKQ